MSIGVDRLLSALKQSGRHSVIHSYGPVVILNLSESLTQSMLTIKQDLHHKGIRAEVFSGSNYNMAKQLKYADKRQAPLAVIIGEDEHNRGTALVKDLVLGKELADKIESNEEWKNQPAQEEISRETLIDFVQEKLKGLSE